MRDADHILLITNKLQSSSLCEWLASSESNCRPAERGEEFFSMDSRTLAGDGKDVADRRTSNRKTGHDCCSLKKTIRKYILFIDSGQAENEAKETGKVFATRYIFICSEKFRGGGGRALRRHGIEKPCSTRWVTSAFVH